MKRVEEFTAGAVTFDLAFLDFLWMMANPHRPLLEPEVQTQLVNP